MRTQRQIISRIKDYAELFAKILANMILTRLIVLKKKEMLTCATAVTFRKVSLMGCHSGGLD